MKKMPKNGKRATGKSPGYRHTDSITLTAEEMTVDEKKVFEVIARAADPLPLTDIARAGFPRARGAKRPPSENPKKHPAYRRVLNALRRLVAAGYVRRVERGTYGPN